MLRIRVLAAARARDPPVGGARKVRAFPLGERVY
jgi:hypothetical protein